MKRAATAAAVESSTIKDDIELQLEKIQKMLYNVKSSGVESTAGVADELPIQPELFVKNFGYLPLPLKRRTTAQTLQTGSIWKELRYYLRCECERQLST